MESPQPDKSLREGWNDLSPAVQGVLAFVSTVFVLVAAVWIVLPLFPSNNIHFPSLSSPQTSSEPSNANELIQKLKGVGFACQDGGYGAAALQNENIWACGKTTALYYDGPEAMDTYGGIANDIVHGMNRWGDNGGGVFSAKKWDGESYPTWEVMCGDPDCSLAAGKLGWTE
ncbi:hypothetical protein SAMN05216276_1008156 [Streptosporangium subroseum]|uniref:Uncharacterized protein n=1 Tax=Streptosporangium subroseum TaxID=106412 RepID=A0A239DZT7_9ACTN|nr:hypothetical protein [Streptosporangium subroseum]SNS37980.1 hypothetical protein SAMN05216276_1008156 [Streptosporangium subroseum]